jgi:hypothetical protein
MSSKSTINKYKLPVPKDLLKHIDRTSSPAHVGQMRNAIDLVADEDSPVLAAADGIVTLTDVMVDAQWVSSCFISAGMVSMTLILLRVYRLLYPHYRTAGFVTIFP